MLHSGRREAPLSARHTQHDPQGVFRAADKQRVSEAADRVSGVELQAAGHTQEESADTDRGAQLRPAHTDQCRAVVCVPHGLGVVAAWTATGRLADDNAEEPPAHDEGGARVLRQDLRPRAHSHVLKVGRRLR